MNIPSDLHYTSHDEWIRLDGDIAVLGITDFAQDALGEIVYVELPEVGDSVEAGGAICEVESVKAVAEVYSPVAGEVVAVNEELDGSEETVNQDPYGGGWLVKISLSNPGSLDGVMDAEAYKAKIAD